MNILITGGTGFIGSQIVRRLHKRGHNLHVVTRFPNKRNSIERITYIDDSRETLRLTYSKQVDVTLHLATNYGRGNNDFESIDSANIKFPKKVLQEAVRAESMYFINTDSYYTKHYLDFPHLEKYTKSKKEFYEILKNETRIYGLNLVLYHAYGPGDSSDKLIPSVVRSLRDGNEPITLSKCNQLIDIIDVRKASEAFVRIIENLDNIKQQSIQCIEVGEGRSIQLSTILDFMRLIIRKHRSHVPEIIYKDNIAYPNLTGHNYVANTDTLKSLGWKPTIDIFRKLTRFVENELHLNNSYTNI
jgi:nucleoside-diphosphate-sugar epimerase